MTLGFWGVGARPGVEKFVEHRAGWVMSMEEMGLSSGW